MPPTRRDAGLAASSVAGWRRSFALAAALTNALASTSMLGANRIHQGDVTSHIVNNIEKAECHDEASKLLSTLVYPKLIMEDEASRIRHT